MRIFKGPVRKDDDVFSIKGNWILTLWLNDDGTIVPGLLLETGMTVIPVGARLFDGEFIGEGFARLDAGKRYPGDTVHLKRHEQTVPMDRRVFAQKICDPQLNIVPFAPSQQRGWELPIYGNPFAGLPVN